MSDKTHPRFLIGVAALAGVASLLFVFGGAQPDHDLTVEHAVPPLFAAEPQCALSGERARARASEAERAARARWERVPYAVGDGPSAVRELGEAVQCFRAAGDREGRARAEADLTLWKRELERIYARSRLNLTLALRADNAQASAVEAKALLSLLAKSGKSADSYRTFLQGVERAARATAIERLRAAEEK